MAEEEQEEEDENKHIRPRERALGQKLKLKPKNLRFVLTFSKPWKFFSQCSKISRMITIFCHWSVILIQQNQLSYFSQLHLVNLIKCLHTWLFKKKSIFFPSFHDKV